MMTTEQSNSSGETEEKTAYRCRTNRRDWRRASRQWWKQADAWDPERWKAMAAAWDPERWKAMAAAWASMFHEGANEAQPERTAGAAIKECPYCAEEIKPAAIRCKHCGTWLAPPPPGAFAYAEGPAPGYADVAPVDDDAPPVPLTRATGNAMVFGVLGGFGRYFGIDPTWLRVAYALGTFFTAIIPGVIVYAILALIIPSDVPVKGESVE